MKEKAFTAAKDSLQKMKEGGNNPSGSFARIPEALKWCADANKASHLKLQNESPQIGLGVKE